MPSDGEELLVVCGAMVLFSAGWILRGVCDALLTLASATVDWMRSQMREAE